MRDVAVIGGGIVGLATAHALLQARPGLDVTVLEKEDRLAAHQTGRNSGVIHSGVYYAPGSLKARTCRAGRERLLAFCEAHGVPFRLCGKVIVAVEEGEVPRLREIERRGRANGVTVERIGPHRLREIEPHAVGVEALWVPEAGIVDYTAMAEALAEAVRQAGGTVRTNAAVTGVETTDEAVRLQTSSGTVHARRAVGCAGLWADRLARLAGEAPSAQIVPFRGEYFRLRPEAERLCNTLIYPVPDPAFPFLGVHLTSTVAGGVECGPNAVLAFARDGYGWGRVSLKDLAETLGFSGARRLFRQHWRAGLAEMRRSLSKRRYLQALQRLVPEVQLDDLLPAPSGVRAQALGADGSLVDDFLLIERPRFVHVLNAPSPAATASLAIGEHVAAVVLRAA